MKIELVKAKEADKVFLLNLRKRTMVPYLERAGIYLSEKEHKAGVSKNFSNFYLILKMNKRIGLIKYKVDEKGIEIL
ncbi:hypothetical protein [Aquimarina celericrescens]|uniref:GNAT family N-acetyltransferase n=1 Tax=Aquimarina celericrescens TaxID=1964542 RepID=A0ABW5ATH3_9FLAO